MFYIYIYIYIYNLRPQADDVVVNNVDDDDDDENDNNSILNLSCWHNVSKSNHTDNTET